MKDDGSKEVCGFPEAMPLSTASPRRVDAAALWDPGGVEKITSSRFDF
jgi:hypothetical protein